MNQCPYTQSVVNRINGETEENELYLAWHEGFEDHKLEMMMKMKCAEIYLRELIKEAKQISELKREIKSKRMAEEQKTTGT